MSIYYVNNSGSSSYPYNESYLGAINFEVLNTNVVFQDGDVIRFVVDGGSINDIDISIASINKSLTFESYDPISNNNATWNLGTSSNIKFIDNGCDNLTIQNLNLNFSESTTANTFLEFNSSVTNFIFTNCNVYCDIDTSNTNSLYLTLFDFDSESNSVTISNNSISNIKYGIYSTTLIDNLTIFNNNVNNNFSTQNGTFYYQYSTGTEQINLTINDNNFYGLESIVDLSYNTIPYSLNTSNIYSNHLINCGRIISLTINILDFKIYSNIFTSCTDTSGVIILTSFMASTQKNIEIYSNTLSECVCGFYVQNNAGLGLIENLLIRDNIIDIVVDGTIRYGIYLGASNCNSIQILRNKIGNSHGNAPNFYPIYLSGGNNTNISNSVTIKNNIVEMYQLFDIFLIIEMTFNSANNWNISYNDFISIQSNSENGLIISNTSSNLIKNFKFNNNILYADVVPIDIKNIDDATATFDYNCYKDVLTLNNGSTITGALSTSGNNNVIGDPLFTDINTHDYYLTQDSPCIETGILNDDIGAIDYIDGVNVYIKDSAITNLNSSNIDSVNIRVENNAFDNTLPNDFNIVLNKNNQFDFNAPSNYPLVKNSIGYGENLAWFLNNKSEFESFSDIDSPPNPGKESPNFIDYPNGLFGYRRSDGQ